jgi:putative ABC transport system substrate-binding protein
MVDTNITGVTSGSIELVAKRLEMLKELLPLTKKVALFGDAESESSNAAFTVAEKTAPKLGMTLFTLKFRSREDSIEAAKKLTRKQADAVFLVPGLAAVGAVGEIAALTKDRRMPFVVYQMEHVRKNGALMSYGSSYFLQGKQSAALLDKILKGTHPSQLPIERPALHELILNVQTAKEIGVKFSAEALNRADELVGEEGKR